MAFGLIFLFILLLSGFFIIFYIFVKFGKINVLFRSSVLALFFFIFVKTFCFDIYKVSTSSMKNSIMPYDFIFVEKWFLSFDYYFSDLFLHFMRIGNSAPLLNRNDIVVFKNPVNSELLVKRVVALSGDTLSIVNNVVYINSKSFDETENVCNFYNLSLNDYSILTRKGYFFEQIGYSTRRDSIVVSIPLVVLDTIIVDRDCFVIKNFSNSAFPHTRGDYDFWTLSQFGPLLVPYSGYKIKWNKFNKLNYSYLFRRENCQNGFSNEKYNGGYSFKRSYVFCLGDNRADSRDSRIFGLVATVDILGRVLFTF